MRIKTKLISLFLIGLFLFAASAPVMANSQIMVNGATVSQIDPPGPGNYTLYGSFIIMGVGSTFDYTLNVPEDGNYHITFDARFSASTILNVTTPLSGVLEITDSSDVRKEIYGGKVTLKAGNNTFRVKNSKTSTIYLYNIILERASDNVETDFIRTEGAYKNYYLPTIIEAEDYNLGSRESYSLTSAQNTDYRGLANLTVEKNTDGKYVVPMREGEWADYTFNVSANGSYKLSIMANAATKMEMYFDGYEYPVLANINESNLTDIADIYFEKGEHTMRVKNIGNAISVDYISFKSIHGTGNRIEEIAKAPASAEELEEQTNTVRPVWKEIWVSKDAKAIGDGSKENLGLSTETSWRMPRTTEEMIKAVAAKGFKTIRIPVSYHNHIKDSSCTIDEKWLERIKTIVDWSLASGMNAIINIHHDNMSDAQMKANYGFCVPENSASLKEQSIEYITAVWKQVATYFKDYGDMLVFEVLNEPRAVGTKYEWSEPSGYSSKVAAANKIIMEYEKAALDAIRSTGGNNASRFVMIPPYAAAPHMLSGWSLPEDSASGKLIVSLHAYTPYDFCMGNDDKFTSSHEDNIKNWLFATIYSNFTSKGIPVIIGETSASDKNNSGERKKWAEYFYGMGKEKNIPLIVWDNMVVYPNGNDKAERHGYFNRKELTWWHEEIVNIMVGKENN